MRGLATRRTFAAAAVCVASVGAATPPVALAASGGGAAPRQYVEVLPGAGGGTAPPAGSPSSSAAQQYVEAIPGAGGGSGPPSLGQAQTPNGSSPLTAAVSAIATGDQRHVLGLAVAMVVVTLALVAAAVKRVRERGR